MGFQNLFYDIYFNKYIRSNKKQIKNIKELKEIPLSILVISNTALGDTILSTAALKSLKDSFPNVKITLLVHFKLKKLFEKFPYIDNLVLYYGGYKKFFSTIKEIKKYNPKMSLIFHGNGPQDIQISVLSGCEYILKHPTKSPLKKYLSYDFKFKLHHTIEDRVEILKCIDAIKISKELTFPLFPNETIENKIDELVNGNKKIVGYQIGAADVYKMWPIERFIELGEKILNYDNDTIIVITGIDKEYELGEKVVDALGNRVLNLCGTCSIEELPYLLKRMNVLITNDTGTMHLAIAIKTPTISLFSTTNSILSGPYQDFDIHKVIQKDGLVVQKMPKKDRTNENMRLINVSYVFDMYIKMQATFHV